MYQCTSFLILPYYPVEFRLLWSLVNDDDDYDKPVIIEATEATSKSLRQNPSDTPGKREIKELQKPAILGTTHTLQEVLM